MAQQYKVAINGTSQLKRLAVAAPLLGIDRRRRREKHTKDLPSHRVDCGGE